MSRALGTGWDASAQLCRLAVSGATALNRSRAQFSTFTNAAQPTLRLNTAARPYAAEFPYFKYIAQTTNGFHSNYDGLQVTLDARNYHGLNFLASYTFSHALDDWTKSSQATRRRWQTRPTRNISTETATWMSGIASGFRRPITIPGIKSPGQMLEGWQISAIWAWQSGFAWAPDDSHDRRLGR